MKLILLFAMTSLSAFGQVIDMHLHGYTEKDFFVGKARNGFESSKTAQEQLAQTRAAMDNHNIRYAVLCGTMESLERYTKADKRFIPGYQDYEETLMPINQFESLIQAGKLKVFGEVMAVYKGRTLADSIYQPYLALCEKYGIPVAYHTGGSFPNAQYMGWPKYRVSFGDPLLIEDVIVRYPKLKLYLMHAGENFYENTLRMMDAYPNLYADLGVSLWLHPLTKDYGTKFLRLAKEYGVLDRVLFGTDQMVWPQAITSSIDYLNALPFLTKAEKEMILYTNAKKFLGITD